MKEVVIKERIVNYQCDHCNTLYEGADECMKCESSHMTNVEISKKEYTANSKYPSVIHVHDAEDNLTIRYVKNSNI